MDELMLVQQLEKTCHGGNVGFEDNSSEAPLPSHKTTQLLVNSVLTFKVNEHYY